MILENKYIIIFLNIVKFLKNDRNILFIHIWTRHRKSSKNIYFNIFSHNGHPVSVMDNNHDFELIPTELIFGNAS